VKKLSQFKFRLQRVLEVREKEEDEKKNRFAEITKKLQEEHKRLDSLHSDMEEVKTRKNKLASQNIKVDQLLSYSYYMENLKQNIEKQHNIVEKSEKEMENARVELLEAAKDKQVLEKIKDKNFEDYKYGLKREEDKMTDQFVSYSSSNNALEE
jgi:flagellar protein FliJ